MTTAQTNTRAPRRPGALAGALIGALALLGMVAPASALAAPVVEIDTSHYPPTVPAGTYARFEMILQNTGDADTNAPITVDFTVPAGLRVIRVDSEKIAVFDPNNPIDLWKCSIPDPQVARCVGPDLGFGHIPTEPGEEGCKDASLFGGFVIVPRCRFSVFVQADEGVAPGTVVPTIHASGGGSVDFDATDPIDIGPPARFDVRSFDGEALDAGGAAATDAGTPPHNAAATFFATTMVGADGKEYATEDIQDVVTKLPPGLTGNPLAYPRCTQALLLTGRCANESQVGAVTIWEAGGINPVGGYGPGNPNPARRAVFNMQPSGGIPALLAFSYVGTLIQVYAELRSGEDYGVTVTSKNAPQINPFIGVTFEVWGVPADADHDPDRVCPGTFAEVFGCASGASPKPFFTLPTSCTGPVETGLELFAWDGGFGSASFLSHAAGDPGTLVEGTACGSVPFGPNIEARPTTNAGDAPSGLDVLLEVPQSDADCPPAPAECAAQTAHLKDTTVVLPEGLVVNPSGANGLEGCSLSEFGLTSAIGATPITTTPDAASCPDASKLATVQVDSPLVDHPLRGSAYIADPFANPFNSLLALYIAIDDPQTGVVVKLAGEVRADPNTGRLTTTVTDNPQVPFETFRLSFFGGAGGSLRTPAICGNHTTEANLNPWSSTGGALAVDDTDTWQITQNCSGSAASQPHAPSFDAGVINPQAGIHTPFVVHLRRQDGSQNFSAVTVSPPQGLVAKLAGTPACSDGALAAAAGKAGKAEQAAPSCGLASQIGSVDVAAGAGPAPYHAPAKAYLAGPYKGAPLSMAVIAPAVAGPFDLGTVVTRIALHVNPATAEITAASDPVPSILQGIPLDIKTISVSLDKPDFALTGTSCDPSAVNGLLTSTLGAVANLSARYQLAECTGLGFKPRMALRLKGGTKRGKHPQLTAFVLPRAGDANIKSVSVAFPRSEFLENAHIRTICTRPDFAADNCPAGAVYGTSTVETPLLDYPLTGNVYLRSSNNLLPDVVPDLRGPAHQPIRIEAAGRTDSIRGGIRNTFDFFPDAPFTRAILRMQGGDKGLLVNSRNICARTYRATVRFIGHNNMTHTIRPKLKAQCKKKKRRKAKRSSHSRSQRLAQRSAVR